VKRAHALVIKIKKSQIIHLLQHHVARVVQNVRARMAAHCPKKSVEGRAVVQILAGMQLKAHIHARIVERIQNRQPPPPQLLERLVDQSCRTLWPRIDKWPRQRA
jgi:hypothetical protein